MCLAVPGKIISINTDDNAMRLGKVSFGGIVKEVCLACVPDARVGDYALVHAGFALTIIDEQRAQATLADLASMADVDRPETTS
jgi:hydrogenase expression/formation protein HypC